MLLFLCSSAEYLLSSTTMLETLKSGVFVELPFESLYSSAVGSPHLLLRSNCAPRKQKSSHQSNPVPDSERMTSWRLEQNPNRRIECPPIRYTEQSSSSNADTAECFSRTDASMVAQSAHMSNNQCCVCVVACDALIRRWSIVSVQTPTSIMFLKYLQLQMVCVLCTCRAACALSWP